MPYLSGTSSVQKSLDQREERKENAGSIPAILLVSMIVITYIYAAVSIPVVSTICVLLLTVLAAASFFYDVIYLEYPIVLYFTSTMMITNSLSFMKVFAIILVLRFIVFDFKKVKWQRWIILPLIIFTIYNIFVLPDMDLEYILSMFEAANREPPSDISMILRYMFSFQIYTFVNAAVALKIHSDKELAQKFLAVIAFIAVAAGIYEWMQGTEHIRTLYETEGAYEEIKVNRAYGPFIDPNIFGWYVNIGIFSAIFTNALKKRVKAVLIVLLYIILIDTVSLSAILTNMALMALTIIYLFRYKAVLILTVLGIAGTMFLSAALAVPNIREVPFIGNLLYRVESQLINPDSGNDMTSGRVGQWEAYGGYYTDSDTVTKLFGGQVFTLEIGMGDNDISEFAPHNTYLDFLIAVGLLGTVILVGNMLFKCFILGYRTFIRDDKISFVFLLYSITWLVMGFNFDFFNSINYMVWYWL